MAFQILNPYQTPPLEMAVTDGQTVAAGDIVRLVSNRVRDATSGGSGDWIGLALEGGTGDAGGTVSVLVAPISATTQLYTAWATAALPGATLDLASGGAGVTTNSNADFTVLSQVGGYVTVVPVAGRITNSGTPGLALTADEVGAVASALGTPTAAAPFATWAYTQANISTAALTADEIAAVAGALGTPTALAPFATLAHTLAAVPTAGLTADEIAAVAGSLGTPSASAPFASLAHTLAAIPSRHYTAYGTGLASAGDVTLTTLTNGITPAVGDIIVGIRGSVIATGVNLAVAAEAIVGTTFNATLGTAGVAVQLVNTLDANTYIFTIERPT